MINVLTADEVRAAEQKIIAGGVDETFLRFNASLCIADGIATRAAGGARTAVFCGGGGNGMDGVLAATRLHRQGRSVTIYLVGGKTKDRLGKLLDYAENAGVPIYDADDYDYKADILVDAIFGIGLSRNVDDKTTQLLRKLNAQANALRLAVDIPTGLNADSGEIMGEAFRADYTIGFSCYKRGMLFGAGRDVCGRVIIEDVGVKTQSQIRVYEHDDFKPVVRAKTAHKGKFGRIYVIGGCGTMVGAPILSAAAAHEAYMNGAGTVTLCAPSIHRTALSSRVTMAMMKFMPDTVEGYIKFDKPVLDEIISRADVVNIGMGMGTTPDLRKILEYLCENFGGTLVIDADGLNAIKQNYGFLKTAKPKIIITPHVGEFERFTGRSATVENAKLLAAEYKLIVVLKSATTIITDGIEVRINATGTPAMAKGGMGDLLGGSIAALACSFSPLDAATAACYRQGIGAERAVTAFSELMLTPREVLNMADYSELYD